MGCLWCQGCLPTRAKRYCSKKCRQAAYRARKLVKVERSDTTAPLRLAWADPPYPGKAWMYRDQDSYAGEVDHVALIAELVDNYDGWVLSTSRDAVRWLWPLCPPETQLAVWGKPHGVSPRTRGPHNCWEALLYVPARMRRPGVSDLLVAQPARGGGDLIGRKPASYVAFAMRLLGALPGDTFADKFPGTGIGSSVARQHGLLTH